MPTKTDTDGVTYLEAIGQAMMSEMEADPDVFLIGEDVGQFGGAFKVTKGFLEKFGPRRVVDTPIAETGFTGLAAGAALVGLRPIVEYQFADFISCAFDPIINVLARHHYRTGDAMPVTMSTSHEHRVTGLETWFEVPGRTAPAPPKWKMFAVTSIVIFVLQLTLNLILHRVDSSITLVPRVAVISFCVTGLMTWVVQPPLARALEGWLYAPRRSR